MSKNLPDHCSRPLAEHARKDWDRIFKPRGPMLGSENYYKDDEQEPCAPGAPCTSGPCLGNPQYGCRGMSNTSPKKAK